ncbi:MAG: type II secretion system F family protein [Planctomycetota bacterium]|nr:type II secretion system F family protein [Planctomycetota bacterium]
MSFEAWCLEHSRVGSKRHKSVKLDDQVSFFQQLATLINSGTPLLESILICAQQAQSQRLSECLDVVAEHLMSGSSFSDALRDYPELFSQHWIEVIQTAEVSGQMGPVLVKLNEQIRESRETRRKIVSSLTYPIALLTVAFVVVLVLLWVVVPTFTNMFREMGSELPGITQFIVSLSDGVAIYGPYFIGGVIALVATLKYQLKRDSGRRRIGAIGLATPLVGDLLVQTAMYRFSSNLSLMLKSGVAMLEALGTMRSVFSSNPIYRDAIADVESSVMAGNPLASALEDSGLFTRMMTDMIRVGEASGRLPDVLEELTPYYRDKVNGYIANLTKLIEPCIISVMGVTIAVVMTSIYLPMFEMAGKVS